MSQDPDPRPGQSNEYIEQQISEAIATRRYPGRSIKEILPGFYTDERKTNYVWLVILAPTQEPFENTLTTVDSNDIRAWHERQNTTGFSDFSLE